MLVVALYRIVELSTTRILGWRYGTATVKKEDLYRKDTLERTLKADGIDVRSLPGFNGIDKLRCLNNAVKHEGKVTPALARFPNWTKGEDLGDCSGAIERFSGLVGPYVRALPDVAIPK